MKLKRLQRTAKEYGGESKIQVMYENKLANGEIHFGDGTLTVTDTSPYLDKIKSAVRVPVALNVYQGKAYLKGGLLMAEAEGWAAQDARISPPFWGGFCPS